MANRAINRRVWTQKQDQSLLSIVNQQPYEDQASLNWKFICEKFNQNMSFSSIFKRQPKQCRQRWNNCLKPGLKQKKLWSHREKLLLFEYYKLYGQKWCKIAEHLDGRSDNNVKNFFYSSVRKLLRKFDKIISLYNRKIRAKKYQKARQQKIRVNETEALGRENQTNLKFLRPIKKQAINKLLLLAESKHTHKVQVIDDLECDLIFKVRSQFINFLSQNQLLEPSQEDQQQVEEKSQNEIPQNQKQFQKLLDEDIQSLIGQSNGVYLNNLDEIQTFIDDLYEITTHTKRKKNGTFALGSLSEKQIEDIIKSKKKRAFKNKNIIKKQLEQQHKYIVPSSKTVRNFHLNKEQLEDKSSIKKNSQNMEDEQFSSLQSQYQNSKKSKEPSSIHKNKKISKRNYKRCEKQKNDKKLKFKADSENSKIELYKNKNLDNSKSQYKILQNQFYRCQHNNDVDTTHHNDGTLKLPSIEKQPIIKPQNTMLHSDRFYQFLQDNGGNHIFRNHQISLQDNHQHNNKKLNVLKPENIRSSIQLLDSQDNIKNQSNFKICELKDKKVNKNKITRKKSQKIEKNYDKILSMRIELEKCPHEKQSFLNNIPTIKNSKVKITENPPLIGSFGCFEINMSQQYPNLQASIQFAKGSQNAINFANILNNVELQEKSKQNLEEDFLLRSSSLFNQPLLRINDEVNEENSLENFHNSRMILNVSNNFGLGQNSMKFDDQ